MEWCAFESVHHLIRWKFNADSIHESNLHVPISAFFVHSKCSFCIALILLFQALSFVHTFLYSITMWIVWKLFWQNDEKTGSQMKFKKEKENKKTQMRPQSAPENNNKECPKRCRPVWLRAIQRHSKNWPCYFIARSVWRIANECVEI